MLRPFGKVPMHLGDFLTLPEPILFAGAAAKTAPMASLNVLKQTYFRIVAFHHGDEG